MAPPIRNTVFDKIKEAGSLTDSELFKALAKDGFVMTEDKFNKLLLDLEIMGLINVAWITKDTRRIEVIIVKEEVDEVLKVLGIDLNYLIKGVKLEAENADRSNDRLKAFSMLWDAAEVIPKQKVTQLTGAVFQGFSDNMLESAKRKPELTGKVTNASTKE